MTKRAIWISFMLLVSALHLAKAQRDERGTYLALYKKQGPERVKATFLQEAVHYDLRNGMKVLDVGGNDGSLIIPLSTVVDTFEYYLEDMQDKFFFLAPLTADFVRQKINPKLSVKIFTVTGTATTLPVSGVLFDRVFVRETFHHFSDKPSMLQEIKRLMAKDAELKIIEPRNQKEFKNCNLLSSHELISVVTGEGFTYQSNAESPQMYIYTFRLRP
ncbi:MAG: methyltransferase domain-containing protein [Bacteroidetes bacterium]|nr:methyltransferase domain-containing protein [Bacteroidota bacterium]